MVLTRWFGVTESDADRCVAREKSDIEEITERSLLMQSNAATKQHRSLCRGTHASGVCVRAQFEVYDVTAGRTPQQAARLAKGIFAKLCKYPSVVPFRHGPGDVVKFSAMPSPDNPARPLQKNNPKGLQDELVRHVREDGQMSWFDFAVQFLDTGKMTYWGKTRDASFWTENASVDWSEAEAPFHVVARLTLRKDSQLSPEV